MTQLYFHTACSGRPRPPAASLPGLQRCDLLRTHRPDLVRHQLLRRGEAAVLRRPRLSVVEQGHAGDLLQWRRQSLEPWSLAAAAGPPGSPGAQFHRRWSVGACGVPDLFQHLFGEISARETALPGDLGPEAAARLQRSLAAAARRRAAGAAPRRAPSCPRTAPRRRAPRTPRPPARAAWPRRPAPGAGLLVFKL
eukprot:gene15824-biopygen23229